MFKMKWWHTSAILCSYGFFKEYRPSEPFISPYLTLFKNFTINQVNKEIYPVGTYSYLSLLIIVFLLTDFLRYKPVLLAGGASAIVTWSLLIWGTTVREMQVVEFFYGFFLASEVAYYTYIYAKVEKKHYQKVTSHTRAAFLLGKASAGVSSQFLLHYKFNYLELNYFTVFGVGITIPLALFLPSVNQSIYFHRNATKDGFKEHISCHGLNEIERKGNCEIKTENGTKQIIKSFSFLYQDFKQTFTNLYVLQWSIWWALATCGYLQTVSYGQLLWQEIIENDNSTLYHGYIEFGSSVLGAAVAFGVGYLKVPWNLWGEIFLAFITISQGGVLYYSSFLNNLYVAYALYITYKLFYDAAITVATYEIVRFINEDSYALVFGINTFIALLIQTILTAVVIDALEINIRDQFVIYGGYHFVIGGLFLIYGVYRLTKKVRGEKVEFFKNNLGGLIVRGLFGLVLIIPLIFPILVLGNFFSWLFNIFS